MKQFARAKHEPGRKDRRFIMALLLPVAVYIHTPFCPSKCGYCDFNSYAMTGPIVGRTVAAIEREIRESPWAGRPAKTVFFGGGTPTFLSGSQLTGLLSTVLETHPPIAGCEMTSEANPGVVDAEKFRMMRQAGFNRLSLGAQSFRDDDLVTLGRVHRTGDIEKAVGLARDAAFENLNLDLMFALPRQNRDAWDRNLRRVLQLAPEHLSLYCLTIEPNTAFHKLVARGELALPDEDEQVTMYEHCLDVMDTHGYRQYEISNFALPGRECQHNLCYWHGEEYLAYGPGAVGVVEEGTTRRRYTNRKHPERYAESVEKGERPAFESEELTPDIRRIETIMLGLRLNEGFDATALNLPEASVSTLVQRGWAEASNGNLRLTRVGRHFCTEAALILMG
jgi:oxygen-independent coproporphyrinogen-3 oxidase